MRLLCLVLPALGAAMAASAADAPFALIAKAPDYVVTMAERRFQGEEPQTLTVKHHRDWTSVDRVVRPYRITDYFSEDGVTEIHVYQSDLSVQMVRSGEPSPWRDTSPRNTGQRQSHLGESCTVWDVWRVASGPTGGLTHLSCITDDGIELWHKSVGQYGVLGSAEAIRLERRAVAPDEVRPLPRLLVPDWWTGDLGAGTTPAAPDHGTVMTSDGNAAIRTTRRHGAWQAMEENLNGARRLRVEHDSGPRRPWLEYSSDKSGAPKLLSITRLAPAPSDAAPPKRTQPVGLNRTEMILGENCRWFDMWPGAQDGGLYVCQTDDGIVLKQKERTIASTAVWTAMRLVRRPVSVEEIKLPDILHDARAWGIK